jgi:hypothetical protein
VFSFFVFFGLGFSDFTQLFGCGKSYLKAGFTPMEMLYRDKTGKRDPEWVRFLWPWARPASIYEKYKAINKA